ncbi:MAG: hypothetical protein SYC29_13095 [Planctomycetota bacterium]|nr:hypothetical protein [Planctomycetota bacterium]
MDKPRPAAERVRPILQAMERSIDAARRQRLHVTGDEEKKDEDAPQPAESENRPTNGEPPQRLKARPKRSGHFPERDSGGSFRSRAS